MLIKNVTILGREEYAQDIRNLNTFILNSKLQFTHLLIPLDLLERMKQQSVAFQLHLGVDFVALPTPMDFVILLQATNE